MLTQESRLRDFPSLANRIYLNTAAEGIPPQSVVNAMTLYGEDKYLGMDGRLLHSKIEEGVRAKTAELYGMRAEDIGLTSCSSEAYNLLYLALQLRDGDEVVINDLDFPAGMTPWLSVVSPAKVKVWRSKDGSLDINDLIPLLTAKTRFVNTSLVSFYNGFHVDVDEIAEVVRKYSPALLGVDVTQALGRLPMKVDKADVLVSSTHKWILGSHGGGLIGINPERADEWTVPAGGWYNLENAFDESRYAGVVNKKGAASFSAGMPNYPALYPINAALEYILNVGVEAIDRHCLDLVSLCREGIAELPVEFLGPRNPKIPSGIIAFTHPNFEKIYRDLHAKGIHIMSQAGRIRVSIHGYNNKDDIEEFLGALRKVLAANAA
jgi:cysteine desulfurase/selenocysteine lyase